MEKKNFRFLSAVFFILGLLLLLEAGINGAVVGISSNNSNLNSVFGVIFIIISLALLSEKDILEDRLEDNNIISKLNDKTTRVQVKDSVTGKTSYKGRGKDMLNRHNSWYEMNAKVKGLPMPASLSDDYRRLVHRLGYMEKEGSIATYGNNVIGLYLSNQELKTLRDNIIEHVPEESKDFLKNSYIFVSGSL